MKRILFLLTVILLVALPMTTAGAAEDRPNFIFNMADDLGNADLSYRGSDIRTPNIEKLANGGVRLESFYGQQVCTPSRAAPKIVVLAIQVSLKDILAMLLKALI